MVNERMERQNFMDDTLALEDLLNWLPQVKLDGSDYSETYISLSYALEDVVEKMKGFIWTDALRGYFHQMGFCMRQWIESCRNLQGHWTVLSTTKESVSC